MKTKIFITGISSEMVLTFIKYIDLSKYEIYGLSRAPEAIKTNLKINLIKGDILDLSSFQTYIKECSIIIHAAAITHSFNQKKYFDFNLEATKNIVKLAIKNKVEKFIFISSNTAGERSGAYGKTKFLAEKYIKNNFPNWLILRPSEVYGVRKSEGIDIFISDNLKNPIAFYPAGVPSKLYPIHIDDVGSILYNIIFREKLIREKITICGPKGYSFPELLKLIEVHRKKFITTIPIAKKIMFLIEKICEAFPFYIGIIPDQISRLYSEKNTGTTLYYKGEKTLESYLKERPLL